MRSYHRISNSTASTRCPKYASNTCFEASSTHTSYVGTEEFKEDYRGCSPFGPSGGCSSMIMDGVEHTNCKTACRTDNCNTDEHQTSRKCYSCMGIQDLSGASSGVSDSRCWDPELFEAELQKIFSRKFTNKMSGFSSLSKTKKCCFLLLCFLLQKNCWIYIL